MGTNFLNLTTVGTSCRSFCLSAVQAGRAVAAGKMKPSDVLSEYITNLDKHETQVGAWSFINRETALETAMKLDKKKPEGAFFGVPFGIKDNIDAFDMPSGYGTTIYDGYRPARDASCVAGMRASNAIALGKTVCAEFAHRAPGKTANPWNINHTPGGSSSGSAAAVASGMVPIAIGTQTTGSVIRPAAYCGVVGYKPTYGDFNISGVLANTPSFDTLGFFSTSIEDLVLVRKTLLDSSVSSLEEVSVKGTKVAIARKPYWEEACSSSTEMVEDAANILSKAGATILEFDDCGAFQNLSAANISVSGYEFARTLAHERLMSLEKLSEVLREGRMADGLRVEFNDYLEAKKNIEEARVRLNRAMDAVDFVICPAAQSAAPESLSSTGSADFNMAWTSLHTPVVTLPVACEQNSGLPLGLQMIGSRHADDKLLSYANSVFNVLTE